MPRMAITTIAAIIVLTASTPGFADASAGAVIEAIDARLGDHRRIALAIWDYAELGYLEEKSSALLQKTLRDEGFRVEAGVAGIPTAYLAEAGQGGPVIALLSEFDALPGITQTAAPEREEIPGKAGGHACGHHLLGTASLGAAIAVKEWLAENDFEGRVRLYGTPAEEGGSGKVYMVRAGLFDDVDAVLTWHPSDVNRAGAKGSLANRSAKFRFHGVSAHAAAAPEKARSALDGVEAFNYMINLLREHVPQETRIHYVITSGGKAPNVVPDFAEVYYYVRHPEADMVRSIWERIEKAARGAAGGTGTQVDLEVIHGNMNVVPNEALAELMQRNLEHVGGIEYDATEQAFAEKIFATLDHPEFALGSEKTVQPIDREIDMGSTDVGDISWIVPTTELETATWVPGTSAHSWQAIAAGGTTIGIKGLQVAAKTLALTAIDLYRDPERLRQAGDELKERRGAGFEYRSLLGDRDPPLDYRR
ncbi:MAG: amidohydrolase [Thermoanaerobaculia bacterium]